MTQNFVHERAVIEELFWPIKLALVPRFALLSALLKFHRFESLVISRQSEFASDESSGWDAAILRETARCGY
jgi:hypothetical protein